MLITAPHHRSVLTYGCFDLFDATTADFLRRAARMGDALIVGCATDALADALGTPCRNSFAERQDMLMRCRYVDRVLAQHTLAQRQTDIVNYDIGLLVVGAEPQGCCDHLQEVSQVRYLSQIPASENGNLTRQSVGNVLAG